MRSNVGAAWNVCHQPGSNETMQRKRGRVCLFIPFLVPLPWTRNRPVQSGMELGLELALLPLGKGMELADRWGVCVFLPLFYFPAPIRFFRTAVPGVAPAEQGMCRRKADALDLSRATSWSLPR